MRCLLLVPLLAGFVAAAEDEPPPPLDPKVILKVELATRQREFHMGEIIPLKLFFSSRVRKRYRINEAQYDRSGRMNYEHFNVTPAQGAEDPIPPDALDFVGGGLTNIEYLTPKPWSIQLNLNEWVRFTAPGEYKLTISSERVEVATPHGPYSTAPVTAKSNEIAFRIVPAEPEWQKRAFDEAVKTINENPHRKERLDSRTVDEAWDVLRYLGTVDAARELAKRYSITPSGGHDFTCSMGLICSPEHQVALEALKQALADPDRPISPGFLGTLTMVEFGSKPADESREDDQRKVLEEFLKVLPNKRGAALPISLSMAINHAWNLGSLPQETLDRLVSQVLANFDQLPVMERAVLLSDRWEKIKSPTLLPIVRRYAQVSADSLDDKDSNLWDSPALIGNALERWFELDPVGARPFIIREICQPAPRFGTSVLGILPEETLVEVESQLVEHFAASRDFEASSRLASLIRRYATAAVLPQILKELDAHLVKWSFRTKVSILAYVLRVDPETARSRIERAIQIKKENFSPNNESLLEMISAFYYNSVMEEITIRALDDRDLRLAGSAATTLAKFGSPAAESALVRRYESWSHFWAGRETKLNELAAWEDDALSSQRYFGEKLVEALASGRAWLTDQAELQCLIKSTKVQSIQRKLENYLARWDPPPLTISVSFTSSSSADVAQYNFEGSEPTGLSKSPNDIINALEQKVAQFPPGTEFALSIRTSSDTTNQEYLTRLRTFLVNHGMAIKKETVEKESASMVWYFD